MLDASKRTLLMEPLLIRLIMETIAILIHVTLIGTMQQQQPQKRNTLASATRTTTHGEICPTVLILS